MVYIALSGLSSAKASINVSLSAPNSTNLYPLNTTRFILQVNNTGSSYIKNLDVGFYLGNGTLSVYNVSLPPGKGARIPINYTYTIIKTLDDFTLLFVKLNMLPGSAIALKL